MNKKRGTAAGFLAALLALSLTACNKPAAPPASSAASTPETAAQSTAATESTAATTTTTTTTDTQITTTTTKKKPTAKKTKPKTTAPTKATLPSNAPTGSPTPPPTTPPTENRFVLSAQGKAALARYQKSQEKFSALDSFHYTGDMQIDMSANGLFFMAMTSSRDIHKNISVHQLYTTNSSTVAGETSQQSVYIDGVTIFEKTDQSIEQYDFDQNTFDSSYDFFSFNTLEENQILGYTTEGSADVFTLQLSEEDAAFFEESFGQVRNPTTTMKVSYTPEGYVSTEIDTFQADIGVVDETNTVTGWYTLRIVNKTVFDKPGKPLTVPKPDWVPAT